MMSVSYSVDAEPLRMLKGSDRQFKISARRLSLVLKFSYLDFQIEKRQADMLAAFVISAGSTRPIDH